MLSLGVRIFVVFVFVMLGLTFLATTATLIVEFKDHDWFALAALYSHLFVFFPTFGLLALCAFYVPAAVFTDFYWHHVNHGRLRFSIGFLALILLSLAISRAILSGDVPALFSLTPESFAADAGVPPHCDAAAGRCKRASLPATLDAMRLVSGHRVGLSPFVRDCDPDPFMEAAPEQAVKRYCIPARVPLTAAECCKAQALLAGDLARMGADGKANSLTDRVHTALMPLMVFFLLMLLVIGLLLAGWRRQVDRLYGGYSRRIERGVIIGAFAMMVWPLMNHAYLQAVSALYGANSGSLYVELSPLFSLLFGCWALLILLFFFRRHERDAEAAAKIAGGIASAVAVLKYNQIIDYSVRLLGAGADPRELIGLGLLLAIAFIALFWVQGARETPAASAAAQKSTDQA